MGAVETYFSKADSKIALALAKTPSPFTIEMRFLGGLTPTQMDVFKKAADRWSRVIVGDLPAVKVGEEVIDDLLILVKGEDIDGLGGILGQAGPREVRPLSAGIAAYIPAVGEITLDVADLPDLEQKGLLPVVVTHEIGHMLAFGRYFWGKKQLLDVTDAQNPLFKGPAAMKEYGELRGTGVPTPVPVEDQGGPGTKWSHWREVVFDNELMTGYIDPSPNPLSRLTVASLQDVGHVVDLNSAEPYELPNLLALAESGRLPRRVSLIDMGTLLPIIPRMLPEDSLV